MPIDAILFGGRRSTAVPLVTEACDWEHGVFMGATMGSEKTAAAAGTVGELRLDPFAMLPFCGYNMADYFAALAGDRPTRAGAKLPKIFYVNWFRKGEDGKFLWPGYGENRRVLAWVFARCAGHGAGRETPIGVIPPVGGEGIDTTRRWTFRRATWPSCCASTWRSGGPSCPQFREYFLEFDNLPAELTAQLDALEERLGD